MAGSVNKVTILGNLGRDPEIRTTNSGSRIATFTVATSESWRDRASGEKKEKTEWHRVTVWPEGLVNVVENYVRKGDKIYVEGKLETRKWTDQQGQDRYSTEITVSGFGGQIVLVGGGNGGNRGGGGGGGRLRDRDPGDDGYTPPDGNGRSQRDELDDEIPF